MDVVQIPRKLIEQIAFTSVQRLMERVRIIIGSVLPALWLLTAGQGLANAVDESASEGCVACLLSAPQGKRLPSQCSCFQNFGRCANRRIGIYPGPDGSPPFIAADPALNTCVGAERARSHLEASFGLAQSWQFLWRTASEPRAPSSLS